MPPNYLYVVTLYVLGENGQISAVLPKACPICAAKNGTCRLSIHHHRHRANGPGFPLCVVICREQGVIFTLYPPGWVPYGHRPIVNAALDWDPAEAVAESEPFAGTVFQAALDADAGQFWPRVCHDGYETPRYTTQIRRLHFAAGLLGIAAAGEESQLTGLANIFALPGLLLRDKKAAFKGAANNKRRGLLIRTILDKLSSTTCLFRRLAAAGAAMDLWQPLHVWSAKLQQLLPPSFPYSDPLGFP